MQLGMQLGMQTMVLKNTFKTLYRQKKACFVHFFTHSHPHRDKLNIIKNNVKRNTVLSFSEFIVFCNNAKRISSTIKSGQMVFR